jgi:hypothetical protein
MFTVLVDRFMVAVIVVVVVVVAVAAAGRIPSLYKRRRKEKGKPGRDDQMDDRQRQEATRGNTQQAARMDRGSLSLAAKVSPPQTTHAK